MNIYPALTYLLIHVILMKVNKTYWLFTDTSAQRHPYRKEVLSMPDSSSKLSAAATLLISD